MRPYLIIAPEMLLAESRIGLKEDEKFDFERFDFDKFQH